MEIPRLILPFLGRRDYLHGTTLFDALLPLLPADADMTFKFSRMVRSNCVSVRVDAGDATLAWKSATSGAGTLHVRSLDAVEPLERRAYPESMIAEKVVTDGKSARFEGESPFSFVATLIPLHKVLLAANVQPSAAGQWLFTRLDLARRPASFEQLELRLAGVFADKLAHSTIVVGGEAIGAIYFSWLPK
jgi:hypothetical protein